MQRVVMEATSDYWKPVFYLLEAHGLEPWLVNARDVKHLPGRPRTDKLDAVWLCKLAERQMLRPSLVPPLPIRRLRDLTRYRVDLVAARTAEKPGGKAARGRRHQAVGGGLRHFGVSGRAMMAALIAGERDPKVLADLARGSMRTKTTRLEDAFNGHFGDHNRFLLTRMLARIDGIDAYIAALDEQIETHLPLSPRRPPDWMTSPASGRSRPRPSSPRSGWTCRASRPPGTCVPGPSSPRGCAVLPARQRAMHPPGMTRLPGPYPRRSRGHRRQNRHFPGRTLPPHRQTMRQATCDRRGRVVDPGHHLASTR